MSDDPLAIFNDILAAKDAARSKDAKAFPGKTAPKNRVLDNRSHSWLQSLPSVEYLVNGSPKVFYTIGALAQALGRKPVTIRSWESKGWIPAASFRTPPPRREQLPDKASKGRRLYSESQLVFLVEAAMTYGLNTPSPTWPAFRKHVKTQYPTT